MKNVFATALRAVSRSRFASAVVLGFGLCSALTALAVHAYHYNARTSDSAVQPVRTQSAIASTVQQSASIQAEVVTIQPTGFEPREITRPKGFFLLAVENRSGLQTIQLRLDREAGARLRDLHIPGNRHDWKDGLDLPPGRYVLSEAYHPDWSFVLTITAR